MKTGNGYNIPTNIPTLYLLEDGRCDPFDFNYKTDTFNFIIWSIAGRISELYTKLGLVYT